MKPDVNDLSVLVVLGELACAGQARMRAWGRRALVPLPTGHRPLAAGFRRACAAGRAADVHGECLGDEESHLLEEPTRAGAANSFQFLVASWMMPRGQGWLVARLYISAAADVVSVKLIAWRET